MGEENKFYEKICRECENISKKQSPSYSDVQRFNELCKAKKNLEMMGQYSERRYSNTSSMTHEQSYGMSRNNSYGNQGGSYTYGQHDGYMSNHSIIDRLINATEGLMDQAGSDFERKVLKNWANRMRTEGYGDEQGQGLIP